MLHPSDFCGSERHHRLQEAFPIVDIIPLSTSDGDLATAGLDANLVYNIPNFVSDAEAPVHGVAFEVNCGKIPGLTQSGPLDATNGTFPIHVHDELEDIQISASKFSRTAFSDFFERMDSPASRTMNVRSAQWRNKSLSGVPPPPVIFIASTFRIVSVNETVDALVSLDPAVSPINCFVSSDCCKYWFISSRHLAHAR